MPQPSRATYVRRRAVAGLAAGLVVFVVVVALARGGGDGGPASTARSVAPAAVRPAPRTDVVAVAERANVPVLCYHQVRPITGADAAGDRTYIVPPKALEAQMAALERAHFSPVTADQVAAHLATGKPLPRKPVLITFDDASAGQYTRALPILRRHHLRATFFVMTVVLGKPGWLTKGQVRALDRGGMEIAAHTWDHHAVPQYAGEDWRVQLDEPKAELEAIVGHPIDVFAYPFGLWNAAAFSHLRESGFRIAFQLSDKLDASAPMLTVRRAIVGPDVTGPGLLRLVRDDF